MLCCFVVQFAAITQSWAKLYDLEWTMLNFLSNFILLAILITFAGVLIFMVFSCIDQVLFGKNLGRCKAVVVSKTQAPGAIQPSSRYSVRVSQDRFTLRLRIDEGEANLSVTREDWNRLKVGESCQVQAARGGITKSLFISCLYSE